MNELQPTASLRPHSWTNTVKLITDWQCVPIRKPLPSYTRTIQPVIDYGCSVWYNTTCKNVEKLQNYVARIISGNFDYINVRSIYLIRSLKWMAISERCEYFTAMLMFKAINGLVANYLSDSIVMAGEAHDRNTRLSESLDGHIPSHNSSALKRSFIHNGSVLWNALPEEIKASH